MIKRLTAFVAIITVITFIGGSLGIGSSPVLAAAPICYNIGETGEGTYARVITDCTLNSVYQEIVRRQHIDTYLQGQGMVDGMCYAIGGGETILEYRNPGPECDSYAEEARNTAGQPPKCLVIQNNKALSKYDNLSLSLEEVQQKPCTQADIAALLEERSITPEPGICYIFDKQKTDFRSDPCLTMLQNLILGGNNQQARADAAAGDFTIENAERDKNINCGNQKDCLRNNSLVELFTNAIKFFTIIIGVVVTAVIVWSGFTYARAGGDPNTTAEAKNRIKNAIIALAVYIFLGALMNWAIPGGLF